jgi:hypothetical protein
MGYPDPCIALPRGASDDKIDELCQDYTTDLLRWIEARVKEDAPLPGTYDARRVYDGSVRSACKICQEHPHSPFNTNINSNTRRTYLISLRTIERDCGGRQIRNLSVIDIVGWYAVWRRPAVFIDQDGKEYSDGIERIDRAHDCVAMFKTVLRFCAALHLPSRKDPHCEDLAKELEKWHFEKGGAREQELSYAHASAFVRTALDFEARAVMEPGHALSMAIGVATQFELIFARETSLESTPRTRPTWRRR